MARSRERRTVHPLDWMAGQSPWLWAAAVAAASPWLRLTIAGWTVYPLFALLSVVVAHYLFTVGRPRGAPLFPFWALLLAGAWMAAVSLAHAGWADAALIAAALASGWCWGWLAWQVGAHSHGAVLRTFQAGLLVISLGLGFAIWLAGWQLPALCRVLNCDPGALPPPEFHGVWASADQFLMHLFLAMPAVASLLIVRNRLPRTGRILLLLLGLALLQIVALLSVPGMMRMLLIVVAAGGIIALLVPERNPRDMKLLAGLIIFAVFSGVVLYGTFPTYLRRLETERSSGRVVLQLQGNPPISLSSGQASTLRVLIRNTGWQTLSAEPSRPAALTARILFSNRLGETRVAADQSLAIPRALPPQKSLVLEIPVRSPPWLRKGFLIWRLTDASGRELTQEPSSSPGFRFKNADFNALAGSGDNWLSVAAERARTIERLPLLTGTSSPNPHRLTSVVGDVLDTLVFSPIWGLGRSPSQTAHPFDSPRPLLAQIVRQFGLVGLLLVLWAGWNVYRRARELALHSTRREEALTWKFTALLVVLLGLSGLVSNVLGSWHAVWGLFLLSGYVEGRHALTVPRVRRKAAARRTVPPAKVRARLRTPRRRAG